MLTTGSWPTQMAARCSLPRELEACCEEFRAFYLASHSGRKLSWQTNMGNAGAPALTRARLEPRAKPSDPACGGVYCRHLWSACLQTVLSQSSLLVHPSPRSSHRALLALSSRR